MIATGFTARLKGDRVIWFIVALLCLFSILSVYSSTKTLAYRVKGGDTEFYLLKQLIMIGGGLALMYIAHLVNYMNYAKLSRVALYATVPLLVVTMFSGRINDAARWVQLPGLDLTFQTSDLAKLALVLFVARQLSLTQESIKENSRDFWQIFLPVLGVCALIAPSNLSTAAILFLTSVMLMFIGRVAMRNLWYTLLIALGFFAVLVLLGNAFPDYIRLETWASRVQDFLYGTNVENMRQIEGAKIAIAKGGFFGVGPGNGTQANYVVHAYSDFIYCIIIEEFGLLGGLVILLLYLGLLFRAVRMVTRNPKAFGAMLALGLSLMLVLQALAHMAVNVNLVPVTGQTLPLISLGGTSLILTCLSLGIILSVSKHLEVES
jgi:cell division protein FtsW